MESGWRRILIFLKTFNNRERVTTNGNEKKGPPWATDQWRLSKKNFFRLRDKSKNNPSDSNRERMASARRDYKSLSRRLQGQYDTNQTDKLMIAKFKNVKLYWKMLAGSKKSNEKCPIDTKELYNHFLSLSDPEGDFFTADSDISESIENLIMDDITAAFDELNVPFSLTEVLNAIKQLKNGKAGAEDLLLNEFFIHGSDILPHYIASLFNFVFESGVFPEDWCDGLLVALHKKGSKSIPGNYRGITLLSALGKLFTRVLNNRLDNWGEMYSIYVEAQNGFRRGRGTVDSAFVLQNIVNEFLEQGKKLYVFFIDYSKAFDYIVHENL